MNIENMALLVIIVLYVCIGFLAAVGSIFIALFAQLTTGAWPAIFILGGASGMLSGRRVPAHNDQR